MRAREQEFEVLTNELFAYVFQQRFSGTNPPAGAGNNNNNNNNGGAGGDSEGGVLDLRARDPSVISVGSQHSGASEPAGYLDAVRYHTTT